MNAEYRLSLFDNNIASLTFDNPFRVVDSSPAAVVMTSGGGPATGRIALYPSNEYHEGSVSTVVTHLPARGVLSAFVSAGFLRQNEPLIPFSTNSDAFLTAADGRRFRATDPSGLPRPTAEASMNTQRRQVGGRAKPRAHLRLWGQYRPHALQNNATPLPFRSLSVKTPTREYRRYPLAGRFTRSRPITFNSQRRSIPHTRSHQTRGFCVSYVRSHNRSLREVAWMNDHRAKVSRPAGRVRLDLRRPTPTPAGTPATTTLLEY